MGEVAASGGYYISAPADTIVAQPNTITGSIGIFGLWFNVKELINNKLGVTTDVVSTGQLSDFMNPARDLTEVERTIIQSSIEDGYETFISRVAEGRGMHVDSVKKSSFRTRMDWDSGKRERISGYSWRTRYSHRNRRWQNRRR